jgi:hypothetical protein
VEPIFGLAKDNGLRPVYHLGGLFKAPHCRQTIHEDGMRRCPPHFFGVYLKRD